MENAVEQADTAEEKPKAASAWGGWKKWVGLGEAGADEEAEDLALDADGVEDEFGEGLQEPAVESLIDPLVLNDGALPTPVGQEDAFLPTADAAYAKNRPVLIIQSVFLFSLIFLKYGSYFTQMKFRGLQTKIFGSLLLCQCLLLHQKTSYSLIWLDFDGRTTFDAMLVCCLFFLALLNLTRLNHFVPDSWRGEYQLMAQRVMDRNAEELNLTNAQGDVIYENHVASACAEDQLEYYVAQQYRRKQSAIDSAFAVMDFLI